MGSEVTVGDPGDEGKTLPLPPPRAGGGGPDEKTRPVAVTTRHDEQTVIFESNHPRPTLDDGGQWVSSYRPSARVEGDYAGPLPAPSIAVARATAGRRPAVAAVVVAAAAFVGVLGWALWPSGGSAMSASSAPDPEAQRRLIALLPAGYPAGSCTATELPKGAVAAVNCATNADPGGPPVATYALMKDDAALSAAVGAAIAKAKLVDCPDNTQSPGPWRRNALPQKIAGTLVCALPDGRPEVTWTNDADLVLNAVRAGPEGPTLDQLYQWWSAHS